MDRMISEPAGVTNRKFTRRSCQRCSGYMEDEMCIDLESDSGSCIFWVHRCIQCGDMVDETILRNRSLFDPEAVLVAAA